MATFHGGSVYSWLLERGWTQAPMDEDVIGDPTVTDPVTGEQLDVYTAVKRQRERTGEYPAFLEG